jgi:hypothetical protein
LDTRLLIEKPSPSTSPLGDGFLPYLHKTPTTCSNARSKVQRMNQLKITTLVMWITIGLIGLGLTAHKGIFALIKARQAALELHGTVSN